MESLYFHFPITCIIYVSLHAKRIHFKMIDPVIDPQNNPKIDPKINQNNQKIGQSNPFFLSCGSLLYWWSIMDRSLAIVYIFGNSQLQQPITDIFMSAASKSFQFVVARCYFRFLSVWHVLLLLFFLIFRKETNTKTNFHK